MFQEDKYQNNKIIETGLLQMVPTDLEPLVQPSEHFDQVPKLCFLQESTDEPCLVLGLVNALYHLGLPVVGEALLEDRDALIGSGHPSLVEGLYTWMSTHAPYLKPTKYKRSQKLLDPVVWSQYPKVLCAYMKGEQNSDGVDSRNLVIVGGWIFDSRHAEAMPLTSTNLDRYQCNQGLYPVKEGWLFRENPSSKNSKVILKLSQVVPTQFKHMVPPA